MVGPRPFLAGVDWSLISLGDKALLDSLFSLEEIRGVVFGCKRNKMPRPDWYSMAFFQDNG